MENFLIKMGILACFIIFTLLSMLISDAITNTINKIKDSHGKTVILKGTILFNHDKGIKFKVKKDIEIKFKKDRVIKANTVDYSFGCISWGMNKEHAQSKLEDQLVEMVYDYYKNNKLGCKLMEEYIEYVKELN